MTHIYTWPDPIAKLWSCKLGCCYHESNICGPWTPLVSFSERERLSANDCHNIKRSAYIHCSQFWYLVIWWYSNVQWSLTEWSTSCCFITVLLNLCTNQWSFILWQKYPRTVEVRLAASSPSTLQTHYQKDGKPVSRPVTTRIKTALTPTTVTSLGSVIGVLFTR